MSTGHPTTSSKWKDLLGHFPHASTAMAAERLLELLLGTVEHDFAEIRAAVQDQIWAPFKRAEESLRIVETSRSARHMAVDLSDRERELLKQALDDFRMTAAASRDAQRCKASLAAASCARLLGWESEAETLQRFARDELAAANSALYFEYCQSQSQTKRIAHGYLNYAKRNFVLGALAIVGGIAATEMVVTAVAGLLVVTAIAGGRRLTDDRAGVTERLRATSHFGREVFGEIGWHEPEEPYTFWRWPTAPANWGVP